MDPIAQVPLDAKNKTERERSFDELIRTQTAPLVRELLQQQLGLSIDPDGRSLNDPEAEDLYNDILLGLKKRLELMLAEPKRFPIDDYRQCVIDAATEECQNFERAKSDPQARMKNYLRGVIRRHNEFKLWEDAAGRFLCGFAAWEGRRISIASSDRLARLKEHPESFKSKKVTYKNLLKAPYPTLVAEIFNWLGDPIEFKDLVDLVPLFRPLSDRPTEPVKPVETPREFQLPDPAPQQDESGKLESFAEKAIDADETAIVNQRPETGSARREDVHSILEYEGGKEEEPLTRPMPAPRVPKIKKTTGRKGPANRWKPAYTVATILIIGSAALVAVFFPREAETVRQSRIPASPPAISNVTPTPAPEPSPSMFVTPKPAEPGEEKVSSLTDGGKNIRFNESGVASGLEAFPEKMRQNITEALLTGSPKRSEDLSELMGGSDKGRPGALLYPRRIVITEDRPTFKWAPTEGASAYQIRVSDPDGKLIADSGQLPTDTTQWKPSARLQRGVIYSWGVSALVNGVPVAAETNFKLLGGEKLGELATLKNHYQSHLALGIFYIREGVLIEARRELELLVKDNPNSPIAAKLLSQAHSRR
jgi:hypothetical protein